MVKETSGSKKIAIIGYGNMGKAILNGLVKSKSNVGNVFISDSSEQNQIIVPEADWIILSVKPILVKQVLEEIKHLLKNKIIISVAAGVSIENIQEYIGNKDQKIIRLMPNLAVSINSGIIGFYSSKNISKNIADKIKKKLAILGSIIEVKNEKDLDGLMLISACGPAIVCHFMQTLFQSTKKMNLSEKASHKIVLEMIKGTLLLLEKNKLSFNALKDLVATKGGITEEIIKSMAEKGYENILFESLQKGSFKLDKLKAELE